MRMSEFESMIAESVFRNGQTHSNAQPVEY